MLLNLIEYIAIFYYWTWFVWPFVLIFGFAFGLADIIKDEKDSGKGLIWAGIALLIILSAFLAPQLKP